MPRGRTHERANLIGGSLLALGAFLLGVPEEQALAFWVGLVFSTYFLSPDLDLHTSRPYRRWGPFAWIWYPYALLSPHRGLSHTPVLGTLLRVGYLTLVYLAISLVLRIALGFPFPGRLLSLLYYTPFLLGAITADLGHILLDRLTSRGRKRRSRKWRKLRT